jgi:hypothetical protein
MPSRRHLLVLLVASSAGLAGLAARAAANPFLLETPDTSLVAGQPGRIVVRIKVPDGHHVYRDMSSVTVVDAGGLQLEEAVFPKGIVKPDPANPEETREQYESDLVIELPATPGAGPSTHSITVAVAYQGCKGGLCYMPVRETRSLTVVVGPAPTGPSTP